MSEDPRSRAHREKRFLHQVRSLYIWTLRERDGWTFKKIGEAFGLSVERTRQLHARVEYGGLRESIARIMGLLHEGMGHKITIYKSGPFGFLVEEEKEAMRNRREK